METKIFNTEGDFKLELGGILKSPSIAYSISGNPKSDGSNIVWVCHALTANSDVFDWWKGLFGEDELFNPRQFCIISANILGSCYGSTGPLSVNPDTGKVYYNSFPQLTVRDMVEAHKLLAEQLGIERIGLLIGGSLGGQQALEWAVNQPERFNAMVLLATNAVHSPWGIAFNEAQRLAIRSDATWGENNPSAGIKGMKAARSLALLSYRNYSAYNSTQGRLDDQIADFSASSYQQYQGEKLAKRFNAFSYYRLSQAMDSHDIGRGRESIEAALGRIFFPVLTLSMEGDMLFPPEEQLRIARDIPNAQHEQVPTLYGHDGFLIETDTISKLIRNFLKTAVISNFYLTRK